MCLVFGVLSLGPRLVVLGTSFDRVPLPYAALERVLPPLRLSGTPVRMMVIVTLGAAVVVAMVLAHLDLARPRARLALIAFVAVLVVEMWPGHLPNNPAIVPKYVRALRTFPNTGGVLDATNARLGWRLFDQTIYDKPVAFGYVARLPESVAKQDATLDAAVRADHIDALCREFRIRYYVTPDGKPPPARDHFPLLYNDGHTMIYDVRDAPDC